MPWNLLVDSEHISQYNGVGDTFRTTLSKHCSCSNLILRLQIFIAPPMQLINLDRLWSFRSTLCTRNRLRLGMHGPSGQYHLKSHDATYSGLINSLATYSLYNTC
ncbi:hypothetical protein ES332_D08G028800v1 [Gossypium tomentosum]|uniref:Uncharacterized protein n=1 Tax=Gossypium tomentosum TaxID=34277 RepID=A0A5D2JP19_GOSTO|nr:hypothetical protein ES332_D08G028800v1 [Gossypium tomentosum]